MTRHFSGTSDHLDGSTPAFIAKAGAISAWRYAAAQPGQTDIYALVSDGSVNNRFLLGGDITAASGKVAAVVNTSWQGLTSAIPSNNTWHFHLASFSTGNVAAVYTDQGNKGTVGSVGTPSGINHQQVGGRGSADLAYAAFWSRVPNDVEEAFLGLGNNPRNLPNLVNFYYVTASSGTETDRFGSANLTVTGTSAAISSGPPPLASFWTAAAQGNQSATQGGTFPAIDLTTKFEQLSGVVDYTTSLLQVGSAGTALSANGAGTASNLLTVTGTVPAVGSYVSIAGGAKIPVLYVSSQTLLLGSVQTWNNADTVTPYPVAAPTGLTTNGYTITANLTGGTVGAGAVGTYANCLYCATNNSNGALIAYSALHTFTVASSGAAPSFSAGPTLTTANTDGYTFGATCTQTATWHMGAYVKGSAVPSVANLKAGAGTGFVAHVTQALTAATPGSLSLTGLTFPFYDVHQLVTNGSGDSAISSSLALMKSPPAGKQYASITLPTISAITKANPANVTCTHGRTTGDWVEIFGVLGMTQINGAFTTCTAIDSTHLTLDGIDSTGYSTYTSAGVVSWGQSAYAAASTLAVTGDIGVWDAVTSPNGLSISPGVSGAPSIAAGATTVRQTYAVDFYSVSGAALIGAATDYLQDVPPIAPVTPDVPQGIFLPANQLISPYSLIALAQDVQGDVLTATATPLPSGIAVSSGSLTGTTGGASFTPSIGTWTNNSTDASTAPLNIVVGNVTPPNLLGLTQGPITGVLANLYLLASFAQQDDPNSAGPAPAGQAIAQSPPYPTAVAPNSVIAVSLSSGNAPPITPPTPPTVSTVYSGQLAQLQTVPVTLNLSYLTGANPFECMDVCPAGSTDPPGFVYRYFRLPSNARVIDLQMINDPNPSNSSYKCGVYRNSGGSIPLPGADAIFFPSGTSLDAARSVWTSLYHPTPIGGLFRAANFSKRVWELLGLVSDPNLVYELAITAVNPGQAGGAMALRLTYVQ